MSVKPGFAYGACWIVLILTMITSPYAYSLFTVCFMVYFFCWIAVHGRSR